MNHTVDRQHRGFLYLLVAVSLVLGMVGSAQVLPAHRVQAQGAIMLDGSVSSGTADGVSSISVSHTSGTGQNRLMVVGVSANSYNSARTISSVTFTYGTTELSLTEVGSVENEAGRLAAIYGLVGPPSGQAGTVAITFSGSVPYGIVVGVANFAGVDQTTPFGTFASNVGTDTTPTVDVTTEANDLVFDTVFLGAATIGTLTAGASQTSQWSGTIDRIRGTGSTEEATGGTVTMSWTVSGGATSRYWAIGAVPIKPASTDPTITITGTPLSDFSTRPGTPSAEQSYTVSGSNLTDDITITAPTDFEISTTSGSGFGSSLTLTQSGGDVAATLIYARFNRATRGTSSGDITHTSTGATQQDVAVSGMAHPIMYVGDIGSNTIVDDTETALTLTTTANVAAGDDIIIVYTTDPTSGLVVTVSDGVNTYQQVSVVNCSSTTWPDLVATYIFAAYNVTALSDATITISQNTVAGEGARAAVASVFRGLADTDPLDQVSTDFLADGTSTTPSSGPTATTSQDDELLIGAVATTGTPADDAGSWSNSFTNGLRAGTSTASASQYNNTVSMGYRIVSATGAYAAEKSGITARRWTASIATFKAVATYDLTMAVDPAGSGTTDPAVGTYTYDEGSVVSITATASAGYVFDQWIGDVADANSPTTTVTIDASKIITAQFAVITHELTIAVDPVGGGTTDPAVGTHIYDEGSVVPITATVSAGYVFDQWIGDVAEPNSPTTTVTIDASKIITAQFAVITHELAIAVDPVGGGTTDPAVGTYVYDEGTVVPITATASSGYAFDYWTGDVADVNLPTTTVTIDASKTITAHFVDTTLPDTAITAYPDDPSNSADASFSFISTEPGSTFECQLDGGGFSVCTSPKTYTGLADGDHTFEVRAIDASSNVDPSPASYSWTIDTVAPDTSVTAYPDNPSVRLDASFSFASTEAGSTFECQLDGGGFSACTSPRAYAGLGHGAHTFAVRATDGAGNVDLTPASYSWTINWAVYLPIVIR